MPATGCVPCADRDLLVLHLGRAHVSAAENGPLSYKVRGPRASYDMAIILALHLVSAASSARSPDGFRLPNFTFADADAAGWVIPVPTPPGQATSPPKSSSSSRREAHLHLLIVRGRRGVHSPTLGTEGISCPPAGTRPDLRPSAQDLPARSKDCTDAEGQDGRTKGQDGSATV